MSSVNGVPLRRKPLTARWEWSEEKKANLDWGETPLNNQPDYNISSRPPQLQKHWLNPLKEIRSSSQKCSENQYEKIIKRTSSAAFFLLLRALVNIQFNLAAQIPGEIARWKQMPYLTRKCRSGKNNLTRWKTLYFRSFATDNTTKRKNTRKNLLRAGISEIDQTSNLLYIVQSSASRFE